MTVLLHLPSYNVFVRTEYVYRYNSKDAVVLDAAQGVPAA